MIWVVDDGTLPDNGYLQDVQVHVVRATDFDDAKNQAITIGREQEVDYHNSDGETVYLKFKAIEYIRHLGQDVTKVEVATRLEEFLSPEPYRGDHDFQPENSEPIMDDESYMADQF